MSKREKQRKERLFVKVTGEEKQLLQEKARKYGYRFVSPYIRDASIQEKVYLEDIKGKSEILRELSELKKEVQLLRRDHRYNFRLNELKEDDLRLLESINELVTTVKKQLQLHREKVKGE